MKVCASTISAIPMRVSRAGLEPAASTVSRWRSDHLSYRDNPRALKP